MEQKKKKTIIYFSIVSGIIGIVVLLLFFSVKISSENTNPLEEKDDCPYNEKSVSSYSKTHHERASEEELTQWKKIPRDFVTKLWKKGYHWHDILQLWDWKIPELDIPNLKSEQRIGVINGLMIMPNPLLNDPDISVEEQLKIYETNHWVGRVKDLIIIMRKIPSGGPKINIDKRFGMRNEGEIGDQSHVRKIINFTLHQENINLSQCEISVLWAIGAERFGNEWDVNCGNSRGSSGDSAIYLALLSNIHKKSLSAKVAATGIITMKERKGILNGKEIILEPGTNLPIAGLKEKVSACFEKKVNHLVLSKYQSSPNLLTIRDINNSSLKTIPEDYQQVISPEIKEKIQAYFTENIKELRELFLSKEIA